MALPNLTDEFIADTFRGVLHTSNVPLTGATPTPIYDGLGHQSPLSLDTSGLTVFGGVTANRFLWLDDDRTREFKLYVNHMYPVGSIHISVNNVNPGVRFIGTTWSRVAEGKFIAGVGTGIDKNGIAAGLTAGNDVLSGEYVHKLTIAEMPSHTHNINSFRYIGDRDNDENKGYWDQGGTISTEATGGDQPHNNIPPYFGLYVWQRTI